LVDHWLASEFDGGQSAAKVEKIKALDERFRNRPTPRTNGRVGLALRQLHAS
jgi:hypothetical protein